MRTRRRRSGSASGVDGGAGGQDSFLDITSNIVGILIILVMVAGVRATASLSEDNADEATRAARRSEEESLRDASETRLSSAWERSHSLHVAQDQLDAAMFDAAVDYAAAIDSVASFRAAIEWLSDEQRQNSGDVALQQARLAAMSERLAQTQREAAWHRQNPPTGAQSIDNRPTPLARQVEGKEAHFCLAAGRVSHIPLDRLLGQLQIDITSRQQEFMKESVVVDQIGPIDNYSMRYRLVGFDVMAGGGLGRRLELDYAEFLPTASATSLGEPIDIALTTTTTTFQQRLAIYRQNDCVVTLWVYPDSFVAFRKLRDFLDARGYRVAARVCGDGQPISASPRGSHSASQ